MNVFFCYSLNNYSGWGTLALNYIRKFDSSNCIVFCNKNNLKLKIRQFAILKDPLYYLRNPFIFFVDSFKLIKILKILRRSHNDLNVHILVEPYIFFLFFINNFFKKKIFYCIGTYSNYLASSFRWKFFFKFLIARIDFIIFLSSYIKKKIKNKILIKKNNNFILNPYIVSNPKVITRKSGRDYFNILSVGAIKKRKGYLEIIKIIYSLIKTYKIKIRLIIVGRIDERYYYEKLINFIIENNLSRYVKIKTSINTSRLNNIYCNSDIFLLFSQDYNYNVEGFGIVYLEALSRGCNLLISKESGGKDLRKFSKKFHIFDPKNTKDISDKILKSYRLRNINRKCNIKIFKHINSINEKKLEFFAKTLV
jgi:hypothetical protein